MIAAAEIPVRLAEVRGRIEAAAQRSARGVDSVRLVLATKTQPAEALRAAYEAGAREFGENYVQEAIAKRDELAGLADIRWHLIGHLQANKARIAAEHFDLIQTLDSARLAQALRRARHRPDMHVLVEINIGAEASKHGVLAGEVEELIETVRDEVEVVGLMAIPPPAANPERARRYFAAIRELRDELAAKSGLELSELSMGMSDDFEVAIEEGATIVRVGRAVFGERAQ